ncbi:hypothetical protein FRC07_012276 [Ceratobasidium sp. 392]|nr:hypothetical protein FRC07_012276 [Ceratobasidium sp. 392]
MDSPEGYKKTPGLRDEEQETSGPSSTAFTASGESAQVSDAEPVTHVDVSTASDFSSSKKAAKKRVLKKQEKNAKATDTVKAHK